MFCVSFLRPRLVRFAVSAATLQIVFCALPTLAQSPDEGFEGVEITATHGSIDVDGNLSDAGWQGAVRLEQWFETNPGDNLPPSVGNTGWLTYDDAFFYVGLEFQDPEPDKIRAPLGDRDNVPSYTDYGGIIVDTNNDGTTAQMFLANPRGIQYDALSSDVAGEDSAPDYFWESAARITESGWTLEIRIPFSSLRYSKAKLQQWNVMLYRNRPREYRYQMFSNPQPRDSSCFVCNSRPLRGLKGLPTGSHWVVAPYATGSQEQTQEDGPGSPLESGSTESEIGLDARWMPSPDTVIDLTYNPDFSQIESDVAQLGSNERFALFFPEKRPFFLEGIDLFETEINALYTRTFTSPQWGLRSTGKMGKTAYTVLVGEDRGGGSVIIPGSEGSSLARQDYESLVAVTRWRRDVGERSLVSMLYSGREIEGGGFNRVVGPDFRWRPNEQDTVTGQMLLSWSETPDRPDLAEEWNGQDLSGHAAELWWNRRTETVDWFVSAKDFSDDFRADNGFVPQVGYSAIFGETGYTFRPKESRVKRIRLYTFGGHTEDQQGNLIERFISPGFGLDGPWSSFVRMRATFERQLSGGETFDTTRLAYTFDLRPTRRIARIRFDGDYGDQVDFANHRLGEGGSINFRANLRLTDHMEMQTDLVREWLDVDEGATVRGRLFTAELARLRATYNFTARSYLRLIGQWTDTERDVGLYDDVVTPTSSSLTGSLLFAYKINWQTVLFVGFGDEQLEVLPGRTGNCQAIGFRQTLLRIPTLGSRASGQK